MEDPTPTEHMVRWLEGYRAAHHVTHPGRLTTDELRALHDNLLAQLDSLPDTYRLPPGATGLTLYSGPVGPGDGEHSGAVALAMSETTGGRQGYFGDTVAGQVLNDREVQDALQDVVRHPDSFRVLMAGRANGTDGHPYGDARLAMWDEVSREFVRSNPDLPVTAVVPAASEHAVFTRTEVGAYLDHNQGQPLNGRTHAQWTAVCDRNLARGMTREQAQRQVAGEAVAQCASSLRTVPVYQLPGGRYVLDAGPLVGYPSSTPPGAVRTTSLGERLDALAASRSAPVRPGLAPAPAAVVASARVDVVFGAGAGPRAGAGQSGPHADLPTGTGPGAEPDRRQLVRRLQASFGGASPVTASHVPAEPVAAPARRLRHPGQGRTPGTGR